MADHTPLSDLEIKTETLEWTMVIPSGPEDPSGPCGCIMPTVLPALSVILETKKPCSPLRAMPIPVVSSFPGPTSAPLPLPPLPPLPDMSPPAIGGGGGGGTTITHSDLSGPDTGPSGPECGSPTKLTFVTDVFADMEDLSAEATAAAGEPRFKWKVTLTVMKRTVELCVVDIDGIDETRPWVAFEWTNCCSSGPNGPVASEGTGPIP